MRKDLININNKIYSSFMSHDKDIQKILKALFVSSRPYSDYLKRLLIINNPDCLDLSNQKYQQVIDKYELKDLIKDGYIRLNPKIKRGQHQEVKTQIVIFTDHYRQGQIPGYLDYTIYFNVIAQVEPEIWNLNNYKIRPLTIIGCIDGILNSVIGKNGAKKTLAPTMGLTGIGKYQILTCDMSELNEEFGMYSLVYQGKHFAEDKDDINKLAEI